MPKKMEACEDPTEGPGYRDFINDPVNSVVFAVFPHLCP